MSAPAPFDQYFSSVPERLLPLFVGAKTLWEPLDRLPEFLKTQVKPGNRGTVNGQVFIEGDVEIGEGTVIEHGAVIIGPVILGKNCQVRAGAYIRGNVITGDACVIGHTTEVKDAILLDRVRADHFNYIGDSVLGNAVRIAAGAKIANLRFDEKPIVIAGLETGRKKMGVIVGDRCQVAVNVSVGPGVILKPGTWIVSKDQLRSGIYGKEDLKDVKRET